jgi:YaiO family outer membrane protein
MKHNFLVRCLLFVAAYYCCSPTNTVGQSVPSSGTSAAPELLSTPKPSSTNEKTLSNYLETGGEYLYVTNGFGVWNGGYVRSVISTGAETVNVELNEQHEFGGAGTYFAIGDTHTFTANTYASVTVGSSVGGFFLPLYRADAFINQKWLRRKQLITTLGLGYYAAKDPHRDSSLSFGTTYYFDKPWIVENGVRFNVSNPGRVLSPSGFLAVTQGRNKHRYITARIGYGEEAYQIIGPSNVLSSFRSQTVSIVWRQWIGSNWGTNAVTDYYGSPYYSRVGGTVGLFREF